MALVSGIKAHDLLLSWLVGDNSGTKAHIEASLASFDLPLDSSFEDPSTQQSAAIAAAALAVNSGNPAAALIDLLNLMMRRNQQGLISMQQELHLPTLS